MFEKLGQEAHEINSCPSDNSFLPLEEKFRVFSAFYFAADWQSSMSLKSAS